MRKTLVVAAFVAMAATVTALSIGGNPLHGSNCAKPSTLRLGLDTRGAVDATDRLVGQIASQWDNAEQVNWGIAVTFHIDPGHIRALVLVSDTNSPFDGGVIPVGEYRYYVIEMSRSCELGDWHVDSWRPARMHLSGRS